MRLLYFVTLLMVVRCGIVDVNLLFNMSFYHFLHGVLGSAAEWCADTSLSVSS